MFNDLCLLCKRNFALIKRDQENSRDIQSILARKEADDRWRQWSVCSCVDSSWTRSSRNGWNSQLSETDTVAKCHYKVCLIEGLVHTTHPVPFPRPTNWCTSEPLPSRDLGGIVWRPAAAGAGQPRSCGTKRDRQRVEKKVETGKRLATSSTANASKYE